VNGDLRKFLDDHGGVVTWSAACAEFSREVVEYASRVGHVQAVFPGTLTAGTTWTSGPDIGRHSSAQAPMPP
jgi:hypothetical protein